VFVLKHQDGDSQFSFAKGGFSVLDNKLCISIETSHVDLETFPDRFLFALEDFPVERRVGIITIDVMGNTEGDLPNVYVYTTFHSDEVTARLVVEWLSDIRMKVQLSVVSDDVNYYGDEAKPNEFTGECELSIHGREDLWVPV
jgi:hypothetical protein